MGGVVDAALPRYRSHKIVRAAPVLSCTTSLPSQVVVEVDKVPTALDVDESLFARGVPEVGDYLVIYDDGYTSWSPKKAFEEGYDWIPAQHGVTHVFAGDADGRQSADPNLPVSRFRPRYRALDEAEKTIHDDLKAAFAALEEQIERVKPGRYRSLAMTALEESCMWAVKELTS